MTRSARSATAKHMGGMTGQAVVDRIKLAADERRARGIEWRGTPSDTFDWGRALTGLRRILNEIYSPDIEVSNDDASTI